ncbi:Gfo/Idh/MocA family oxidoreductase [Patescibacteria group bacterium]|nr:Gfo/Idh/MocA family oxidoreductase [Patescibacteria group bacterium]MBU1499830.1 Gfo/Idh/MocA family oxidoreductase [Patescibacteria group bacterium]
MNYAIVGFGKMGRLYDKLLNAKYIVDKNPILNRVYFSSVEEFIHYGQSVDLVIVTTPTNNHFTITKKLLMSGYNVLVEKPICLSSIATKELEKIAVRKKLILYQSSLERYNPLVKFLKEKIKLSTIKKIKSYRFGEKPAREYIEETKFDLGIHDVDLWFHLFHKKIPWKIKVGYGKKRREIFVFLKNSKIIKLNLLNKVAEFDEKTLVFSKSGINNPILEMINNIQGFDYKMNERWSEEIKIIEEAKNNTINLH